MLKYNKRRNRQEGAHTNINLKRAEEELNVKKMVWVTFKTLSEDRFMQARCNFNEYLYCLHIYFGTDWKHTTVMRENFKIEFAKRQSKENCVKYFGLTHKQSCFQRFIVMET